MSAFPQGPIYQKGTSRKNRITPESTAYKAFVASLPCAVCGRMPVEVAHCGTRGLGQKGSDFETLPLCTEHHRTGPSAAHHLGKRFFEFHGIDREALIKRLQSVYELQKGK